MGLPRALTALVVPVTRKALGRKRTVLGSLMAAWPSVVGEDMGRLTVPERVTLAGGGGRAQGVLVLRVATADAPTVEYAVPALRDRINAHYGFAAITRIKLIQVPVAGRGRAPPPPLGASGKDTSPSELSPAVAQVDDDDLRRSLASLERAIRSREDPDGP